MAKLISHQPGYRFTLPQVLNIMGRLVFSSQPKSRHFFSMMSRMPKSEVRNGLRGIQEKYH